MRKFGKRCRRVGEVGGRVEHDRGVVGGELHGAAASHDVAHEPVEVLVLRHAGDRAGREHLLDLLGGDGRGQADHPRRRAAREHGAGRLGAVQPGHAVVHQHDVGRQSRAELRRLVAGRRRCRRPRSRRARRSSSSSVSRKMSLSSTSDRRGPASLGRQQERVVRLAAVVHVELELRDAARGGRRAARRAPAALAGEERERRRAARASSISSTARAASSNVSPPATARLPQAPATSLRGLRRRSAARRGMRS